MSTQQRSDASRTDSLADTDDNPSRPIRPVESVVLTHKGVRTAMWCGVLAMVFGAGWWWRGKDTEKADDPPKTVIGSSTANPSKEMKTEVFGRPEVVIGETKGREVVYKALHFQEIPDGAKDPVVEGAYIIIYVPQKVEIGFGAIEPKIEQHPETGHFIVTYYKEHRGKVDNFGSIEEVPPPKDGSKHEEETTVVKQLPKPTTVPTSTSTPKPAETREAPKAKSGAPVKSRPVTSTNNRPKGSTLGSPIIR